jgi:hypothetical protein
MSLLHRLFQLLNHNRFKEHEYRQSAGIFYTDSMQRFLSNFMNHICMAELTHFWSKRTLRCEVIVKAQLQSFPKYERNILSPSCHLSKVSFWMNVCTPNIHASFACNFNYWTRLKYANMPTIHANANVQTFLPSQENGRNCLSCNLTACS